MQIIYGEDGHGQMENPELHYYRYLGRQQELGVRLICGGKQSMDLPS